MRTIISNDGHLAIMAMVRECSLMLLLCLIISTTIININNNNLVNGQFIHIFEVQDENRAPKSDLFDPSQYKYVSPSQLQKQQEQNKLLQQQQQQQRQQQQSISGGQPQTRPTSTASPMTSSPNVPEIRRNVHQTSPTPTTSAYNDLRLNEIVNATAMAMELAKLRSRNQNAYSTNDMMMVNAGAANHSNHTATNHTTTPILTQNPAILPNVSSVTYMQPISRILTNITSNPNQLPEYESEIRKQIRMQHQHSENRYSRTTPLRVSAQNQRQYVVRVPAPFTVNISSLQPATSLLPQQQLPPNLQHQLSAAGAPANQYTPVHQIMHHHPAHHHPGHHHQQQQPSQAQSNTGTNQTQNLRLSTLNSVLISPAHTDNGIPSSLLNSFLQRTQNQVAQLQAQAQQVAQAQAQQAAQQQQQQQQAPPTQNQPIHHQLIVQPQPPYAANLPLVPTTQTPPQTHPPTAAPSTQPQPNIIAGQPTGRSVNGVSSNSITLLQPPITNKESLTDEDIKLIEEHNRKVRMFLQQRQAELIAEQERIRRQKMAEEAAVKAQQEAAARAAAEQERLRRLQAEQEAAARAAAEQERIRRVKAEQEAAARAAAEQERIRKLREQQEAAARAAVEQERIRKLREQQEAAARAAAEQERIARIRADQERIQRIREEQEAVARAAAEQERIRRLKSEQEAAARAAAEQERIRRIKAEQETMARIAAEQERIRRLKAEQEALEQERLRKLREEQEMAARAAAEQERLRRIREEQERYQKIKAEQEALAEQERQRQMRAQQEAAIRLAEAERSQRLQRIQGAQELAVLRYQNANMLHSSNISANSLAYQPEPSLALDEATLNANRPQTILRSQLDQSGLVDAARVRAEKEALAEQERLLRFQASQQALAQQQAAEQNRLRRLREEELLQAEAERLAREAQERQILRARNEQNRLIQAARDAATAREQAQLQAQYTPYTTEDLNKYQTNYTQLSQFTSLNNVRTPEPTGRSASSSQATPVNIRAISADYNQRRPNPNQISVSVVAKNESTFKPAKISLQELPPDLDRDGIPGVAGRDYPTLIEIPKTSFSCARQPLSGYYADTETACQVVHMCQMGGVQDSFICPNGTIWNQEKFACQWWYEVNCATAPSFYALNNNLYKARFDGKSEPDSSSSSQIATQTLPPQPLSSTLSTSPSSSPSPSSS